MGIAVLSELDHVMLAVHEHAPAIASWQRLGFCVRPVRQLVPMGGGAAGGDGGSAAVLLHPYAPGAANFIEIARADSRTAAPALKALLCPREGVAMLVHATPDPAAARDHFDALGLSSQMLHMSLAPMGAGEPVQVDIVLPEPGQAPLMFNAMRMSSTADFERDEWRQHPNTAQHWAGVTYVEQPTRLAQTLHYLSRLYGCEPRGQGLDRYAFQPGRVALVLTTVAALEQRVGMRLGLPLQGCALGALLAFAVRDLAAARHALEQSNVEHTLQASSLVVPATQAHGVAIEFVQS
jgi:Glyoxalase-like domain